MPAPLIHLQVEPLPDRATPDAAAWHPNFGVVVGPDDGGAPVLHLFDRQSAVETELQAYDLAFRGGVRHAVGDVTGDGTPDVVTAPGPGGGPHVKVFDGKTGTVVREFFAYAPAFAGGVEVAVGDVNRDGRADVITGAGAGGGPHVRVFDGQTAAVLTELMAFEPHFRGGVFVASGDLNRDGYDDLIAGPGVGGGPRVQAWDLRTGQRLANFFAFEQGFRGGARVAAGDLNADGVDDLIVAAGSGGGPRVRALDVSAGTVLSDRFAAPLDFRGGVRPGVVEAYFDGRAAVVARTRTGDVTDAVVYTGGAFDTTFGVWVGDGDPPAGTTLRVATFPPLPAGGVNPVRTVEGTIQTIATGRTAMTVRRGDGTAVTIDLDGADPPPPGTQYYDFQQLPPAAVLLGDQTVTTGELRVGTWVRVLAARAHDPSDTDFTAVSVRIL